MDRTDHRPAPVQSPAPPPATSGPVAAKDRSLYRAVETTVAHADALRQDVAEHLGGAR